tara:strand:+ start:448 stop:1053 length:606 start_codon:yes stop_codon:yes gene_type:complete
MNHIGKYTSPLLQGLLDQAALDGSLPTGNEAVGLRAEGLDVPHLRSLEGWCEHLDLDWDAELATLTLDPNGDRGRELAVLVRDDDFGGVAAVISCVRELSRLMGFKPLASYKLRRNIEALETTPVGLGRTGGVNTAHPQQGQGENDMGNDSNEELLKRLEALASIVSMHAEKGDMDSARAAQGDVDRCRREALRRMQTVAS